MIRFLAFAAAAFLAFSVPAYAQIEANGMLEAKESVTGKKGEIYHKPTFENLSKLYWALAKFDLSDEQALDNFLKINECDLYKTYYSDDIEWHKVRQSMREYIEKNIADFPVRYEVATPFFVSRYDPVNKRFDVDNSLVKINGVRNTESYYNTSKMTCEGHEGEIEGYPRNLAFSLNMPIELPFIHMEPELAALYLEEAKKVFEGTMSQGAQNQKYQRGMFLKMKVRVSSFMKEISTMDGSKALVQAVLEGIEVYADPELEKLIYYRDYSNEIKDWRRARQGIADPVDSVAVEGQGGTGNGGLLPDGPLMEVPSAPASQP